MSREYHRDWNKQRHGDRDKKEWSAYAQEYDPVKVASIDGTDTIPHDKGVVRAMNANYVPNKGVKGIPSHTVFIARLNPRTVKETIQEEFAPHGKIVSCRLIRDLVTGKSKRYAFVEYDSSSSAYKAYQAMNKQTIDNAEILVDYEFERLMPGFVPRRLGGGFGGNRDAGQLRFGCKARPFLEPIVLGDKNNKEEKRHDNMVDKYADRGYKNDRFDERSRENEKFDSRGKHVSHKYDDRDGIRSDRVDGRKREQNERYESRDKNVNVKYEEKDRFKNDRFDARNREQSERFDKSRNKNETINRSRDYEGKNDRIIPYDDRRVSNEQVESRYKNMNEQTSRDRNYESKNDRIIPHEEIRIKNEHIENRYRNMNEQTSRDRNYESKNDRIIPYEDIRIKNEQVEIGYRNMNEKISKSRDYVSNNDRIIPQDDIRIKNERVEGRFRNMNESMNRGRDYESHDDRIVPHNEIRVRNEYIESRQRNVNEDLKNIVKDNRGYEYKSNKNDYFEGRVGNKNDEYESRRSKNVNSDQVKSRDERDDGNRSNWNNHCEGRAVEKNEIFEKRVKNVNGDIQINRDFPGHEYKNKSQYNEKMKEFESRRTDKRTSDFGYKCGSKERGDNHQRKGRDTYNQNLNEDRHRNITNDFENKSKDATAEYDSRNWDKSESRHREQTERYDVRSGRGIEGNLGHENKNKAIHNFNSSNRNESERDHYENKPYKNSDLENSNKYRKNDEYKSKNREMNESRNKSNNDMETRKESNRSYEFQGKGHESRNDRYEGRDKQNDDRKRVRNEDYEKRNKNSHPNDGYYNKEKRHKRS